MHSIWQHLALRSLPCVWPLELTLIEKRLDVQVFRQAHFLKTRFTANSTPFEI